MHKPMSHTPGPAAYTLQDQFGKKGAHRYTFQGKAQDYSTLDVTPGPGQYDSGRGGIGKYGGPKYSFGAKPTRILPETLPGPGAYNVNDSMNKMKQKLAFSFSGRPLEPLGDNEPGPGKYDVGAAFMKTQAQAKGPSYSMQGRIRRAHKDTGPGPGQYNYNPKPNKISYSFQGKYVNYHVDETPGPGKYDDSRMKPKGVQYSFSKRYPQSSTTYADSNVAKQMMLRGTVS